jgi:hypothetical protein
MDDSYHQLIKQFLASNKAEALEWLRAGSENSFRNLGEMEADESIQFVQRLFDLGAESPTDSMGRRTKVRSTST